MKSILFVALIPALLLAACAPAATPTPMPDSTISQSVMTMDMYYTFISIAQTSEDYLTPWSMLTLEEQCNPRDKCDPRYFQERWSRLQVYYRLYDCGSTTVTAEEILYPKGDDPQETEGSSKFWTYELVDNNGFLMIQDAALAREPGEGCALALERLPQP